MKTKWQALLCIRNERGQFGYVDHVSTSWNIVRVFNSFGAMRLM